MSRPDAWEADRAALRAAALLNRSEAWISEEGGGYAVRTSADRRRRPPMRLDQAAFERLTREPGLKPRPEGGWRLAAPLPRERPDRAGRPGVIEGVRTVADETGVATPRRVILGESPLEWLARRKDGQGRPWLDPVEVAAGEKLREDLQRAGTIGRLTMSWDAGPRDRSPRGPGADPLLHGRAAKARVAAALEAVGPGLREVLEQVCLRGTALEAAERGLGLPRRSGKTMLKLALQRLAAHYRMG